MKLNCFKAYDIRGRVPDELNEDLARRIGNATAQLLGAGPVVLGRDVRLSSSALQNALTTGIHLGVTIPAGLWSLAGVDLVCLGLGICLAVAARRVQRWQPPVPASQRRTRVQQPTKSTVATPAVGEGA